MIDLLAPLFGGFVIRLPLFIVYIVGLLMTSQARQRGRLPKRAATLLLVGLVLALVGLVLSTILQLVPTFLLVRGDISPATIGLVNFGTGLATVLLSSVAWVLVIMGALERGKGDV